MRNKTCDFVSSRGWSKDYHVPLDPSTPTRKKYLQRRTAVGLFPQYVVDPRDNCAYRVAIECRFENWSLEAILSLCRDYCAMTPELRAAVLVKFFERHHRSENSDGTLACLAILMRRKDDGDNVYVHDTMIFGSEALNAFVVQAFPPRTTRSLPLVIHEDARKSWMEEQ